MYEGLNFEMSVIKSGYHLLVDFNRIRPESAGRPFHLEDQGDPCRTGFSCGNGREA